MRLRSALFALATTSDESTTSSKELRWTGSRYRPAEAALTAGLTLQIGQALFLYPSPKRNWEGGILFDDAVRSALRLRSPGARHAAAEVSDVLYYSLVGYPLVVDVGIVAGAIHGSGDAALQMLAVDLESFALAGAVAMTAEKLGRVRPMAAECEKDPSYDARCGDAGNLNASFMSGHTALAFTGAGLICLHHAHIPLYGGGAPDTVACVAGMTLATTAGMLRVLSDSHYATDVVLGAGMGLTAGYLVPWLLHHSGAAAPPIVPSGHANLGGVRFDFVIAPTFERGGGQLGLTAIF
jgi:membrane-associated phospholipid phosphatase